MSEDFKPVTRDDVTDEKLVAGELRALRNEMRAYFDIVLGRLESYSQRLDRHEERIAALEAVVFPKR